MMPSGLGSFAAFCMTRPEPRPGAFVSGQETLASLKAYQGGSMVGQNNWKHMVIYEF